MLTPIEAGPIVKNIERVFKTRDIKELKTTTYRVVMNLPGFIAHYNGAGFCDHYEDLRLFVRDLIRANTPYNLSGRSDEDTAYYQSKNALMAELATLAGRYMPEIETHFFMAQRDREVADARATLEQYGL